MHVLFTLPHVPLPRWAAGVQLGGPVTLEGTLSALYDGLRLGTLLCCLGAANALANPKRALRVLPGALYELGVAVVVALSVAPQLVESVQRVRRARKLRGGTAGGRHALRTIAIPVLEDALERSLRLAAAMDSRGYGRTGRRLRRARRTTGALMLAGMCGLCVGAYGLLDGSAPRLLGLPALLGGSVLCCLGLALGSRRVRRTQYRPDPWKLPEWVVALSGRGPGGGAHRRQRFPGGQPQPLDRPADLALAARGAGPRHPGRRGRRRRRPTAPPTGPDEQVRPRLERRVLRHAVRRPGAWRRPTAVEVPA